MSFPDPFYRWRPHPWHYEQEPGGEPRVSVLGTYGHLQAFQVVEAALADDRDVLGG